MDHKDFLKEAARLLNERGAVYGDVTEDFDRAARIASLKLDRPITPYDVVIILESVKDSRRAKNPTHYDSHVDGINYRAFAAQFSNASPIEPAAPRSREHDTTRLPPRNGDGTDAVNRLAAAMNAVDKAVS